MQVLYLLIHLYNTSQFTQQPPAPASHILAPCLAPALPLHSLPFSKLCLCTIFFLGSLICMKPLCLFSHSLPLFINFFGFQYQAHTRTFYSLCRGKHKPAREGPNKQSYLKFLTNKMAQIFIILYLIPEPQNLIR